MDNAPMPAEVCPRCGGLLRVGQVLFSLRQALRGVSWDDLGAPDSVRLIDCLKCEACGHSETLPQKR